MSYDHFPVLACLAARRWQRTGPRAFPACDGRRLRGQDAQRHLHQTLSQVPLLPLELNVNARAEQVGAVARTALVPCERPAWVPRQPCVSQATLGLVRLRRHVQRILRFAPREY